MGQQEPYVVQKGQMPSPACGKEEPLAGYETGWGLAAWEAATPKST